MGYGAIRRIGNFFASLPSLNVLANERRISCNFWRNGVRVTTIWIEHYRAVTKLEVRLGSSTALLGENNSGKSAILSALNLFFESAPRIQPEDFYGRDLTEPIVIGVELSDLVPDERDTFSGNIIDGKLRVVRKFYGDGSKDDGKYYVEADVFPGFEKCRSIEKASEKRDIYRDLQSHYEGLPVVRNADEIDSALEDWEARNPDKLQRSFVARFRGFKNVAIGQLREKTEVVFVPAVRDAAEEIGSDKSSPVKQLLNALARQTIENSEKFRDFKKGADEELRSLTSPENVPELKEISSSLTGILGRYYNGSSLNATWAPVMELPISYPKSDLRVVDHEFDNPIEKVGHGLQRAILLSVLEYMATDRSRLELDTSSYGMKSAHSEPMSDILLLIEEPETFQHPSKQRLFRAAFKNLCESFSGRTGIRVQVVYTTHSPLMIDLLDFDEVCVLRRDRSSSPPSVLVQQASLKVCAESYFDAWGEDTNEVQFRRSLHIFTPSLAEGFFARVVVLVEGVGDQAVLHAYYKYLNRDPLSEGIHIVSTTGKNNLAKPLTIFQNLGVPTFTVFDSDKRRAKPNSIDVNKVLQKLCGESKLVDWPEGCAEYYASFDDKVETYVKSQIGERAFDSAAHQLSTINDVPVSDVLKNPTVATQMIHRFASGTIKFPILDEIVMSIDSLLAETSHPISSS